MTDLTDVQRRLLGATLRAGNAITVLRTSEWNVSVRVGSQRICGSTDPLDGLLAARFVELIGKYEDEPATLWKNEIFGVHLYQLTPAGRSIAEQLASDGEEGQY